MRLRSYLIRRAIHTVITLLIVLVLLFLIFRLMPGDPSRFFIAPGQPPQVRDEICVSFGLCKWVSAPGHGYEAQVAAGEFGPYNVTAITVDAAGDRGKHPLVSKKNPRGTRPRAPPKLSGLGRPLPRRQGPPPAGPSHGLPGG